MATRHSARALILTAESEVLLMRMRFPWDDSDIWMLPGGGIEPGEQPVDACIREVREETGLSVAADLPELWHREFFVEKADTLVRQNYFLVRTIKFDPRPIALTDDERKAFQEFRWWELSEIEASHQRFEPNNLADGVKMIEQYGIPPVPINVDELS